MTTAADAAAAAPPEELAWDVPVQLHAEVSAGTGGSRLRLHLSPRCPHRLEPAAELALRDVRIADAETVCSSCGGDAVSTSRSSAVERLAAALELLEAVGARAAEGRFSPRDAVHARAVRFEAQTHSARHPDAAPLAAQVVTRAGDVVASLRAAVLSYERRA